MTYAKNSPRGSEVNRGIPARQQPPLDPVLALNREFAAALVRGRFAILCQPPGEEPRLLSVTSFKAWLEDQPRVKVGNRWTPLATAWLRSPHRRSVRIDFDALGHMAVRAP